MKIPGIIFISLLFPIVVHAQADSILKIPSEVIKAIKDATERESINIPFPIRTVQLADQKIRNLL